MLSRVGGGVCSLVAAFLLQLLWCSAGAAQTNSTDMGDGEVLTVEAIAGIAVGGTVLLVCLLVGCLSLCCCCCVCRRRRKSSYSTTVTGPTQLSNTLTFTASPNDLHEKTDMSKASENDFDMQMNIADNSVMFSGTSFAESAETHLLGTQAGQSSASNPQATDKGYIQMSSAGSAQPSTDEVDGIYLNADTTISADIGGTARSERRSPAHPTANTSSQQNVTEETPDDMYVETNVFLQDRQQQEDPDLYYNKDTIQTIRENRSLLDVVDPSQTHTVYANIDPPPTPDHALKQTATEEKEDYESIDDFFGNGSHAPSPPPASDYYNYKPSLAPKPEEDDNYVEVPSKMTTAVTDPENPYLLEDNEYMYMSRSGNAGTTAEQVVASETGTDTPSYQNIPRSIVGRGTDVGRERVDSKGYTELEYEGSRDSHRPSVVPLDSTTKSSDVMAELHFPSSSTQQQQPKSEASSSIVGTNKRTYVNLLPAGDELYEELT